jgi:PAS domain S-box-containing protein
MTIFLLEDNPGDALLISEYLKISFPEVTLFVSSTLQEAKELLALKKKHIDLCFLDLQLHDAEGLDLARIVLKLVPPTVPVVILTGNNNEQLGVDSLQLGVIDYLNKNDMNSYVLKRCVMYSLERKKISIRLKESNEWHMQLFDKSPLPIIVFEGKHQKITDFNAVALETYGYSREEFQTLKISDLIAQPAPENFESLHSVLDYIPKTEFDGIYLHKTKAGSILYMGIKERTLSYHHKKVKIMIASNLGDRLHYIQEIYNHNLRFKEITWLQSHVVRAPLSRMMGLIAMLKDRKHLSEQENDCFFESLLSSADELDGIIHEITSKSNMSKLI